jgi:hypothetical protein
MDRDPVTPRPPRPPRTLVALLGGLVVTAALVACGSVRDTVPDAVPVTEMDCSEAAQAGRVPDGFEPVAAYRCDPFATVEDATGIWQASTVERLEGDLGPLLDALNAPDEPRWPGPCTADMLIAPTIWLADADGAAIRVAYPVDGCGKPKADAALDALGTLTVVDRTEKREALIESPAARAANCPTQPAPAIVGKLGDVGDLPGVELSEPTPAPGAGGLLTVPASGFPSANEVTGMRLCRYTAAPDPAPSAELPDRVGLPTLGTFVDGRELDAQDAAVILAAADSDVVPPVACLRTATVFVQLSPLVGTRSEGGPITVEVDGCQRLSRPGAGFVLAGDDVLRLIR